MAMHPDCQSRDCACYLRGREDGFADAGAQVIAVGNSIAKRGAGGHRTPKGDPVDNDEACQVLMGMGYGSREAWQAVKGTTGTLEERVAQALRAADRQRSV